ncbi:MAG: DNA polymerase III subunit beta [Bacilli bacterium]|nr:DNA polymerase III subunit beta [Bacilli bacterium]
MRLTIEREYFLKALTNSGHAIAPKNPIPVLSSFKLDLNERGLEVTGSNSEITVRSFVPYSKNGKTIISNAVPGSILIEANILTNLIRGLGGTTINLDIIDNAIANISDGHTSIKLTNCARAEEYSDIDLEPNGIELELPAEDLIELVSQTAYAASTKEQRPVMTAINLRAQDGVLKATTTDSARLARKAINIDSDVRFSTNIPAKSMVDVSKMIEGCDKVQMFVSSNKALFLFDGNVVSARLIPGDYVVSESAIPYAFNYQLQVNSNELLEAMSRISILSMDRESVVKLSMSEENVEVSVKSDRNGSGNEPILTFQYEGEPLSISFNSRFVIEAIRVLKAEDVVICFQAERRPFVVKSPKDESAIELITPMRNY